MDYYRQLAAVESRFRVLKDFLRLRSVRQGTEQRVRGHVAVCVYAALIEGLINHALTKARTQPGASMAAQSTPTATQTDHDQIRG